MYLFQWLSYTGHEWGVVNFVTLGRHRRIEPERRRMCVCGCVRACVRACMHARVCMHTKNWSVKNNSWSVIFNPSQECEEGQHSECYTTTSWGVAILTLRKCYRDLTIRSVALTLPEGCFDTLVSVALTLPEGCCDTLVTPSTGRTDTYTGCFDTFHGFFKNWRCREKHYRVRWTLCGLRVTVKHTASVFTV